jgi:hypothetical protein
MVCVNYLVCAWYGEAYAIWTLVMSPLPCLFQSAEEIERDAPPDDQRRASRRGPATAVGWKADARSERPQPIARKPLSW